ncbi:MAG TPA: biopolymer transporter ExbD [Candidatus Omnitrophota bacterium]|nr:biopolymer transporter ExbD [Candidatus Omnitrophota bacterium]
MRIPAPAGRKKARIEIIPLIDVVFFLLATFVMVSLSMVKNEGIAVNLPSAATSSAQDRKASATITVAEDGSLYLNQEKIASGELHGRLEVLRKNDPELKVFINGDEAADFGAAVRVLDEVRKMGITKVAIQTKGIGRDQQ